MKKNMKIILLILILIIISVGFIFFLKLNKNYKFNEITSQTKSAEQIKIVNSNQGGKQTIVSNKNDINEIVLLLENINFKKQVFDKNEKGWSYSLSFFDENEKNIYEIVCSGEIISINNTPYKISKNQAQNFINLIKKLEDKSNTYD